MIDGEIAIACTCPTASRTKCVHQQYFVEMKVLDDIQHKMLRLESSDGLEANGVSQTVTSHLHFLTVLL